MEVVFDKGKGRGFLLFTESIVPGCQELAEKLCACGRTLVLHLNSADLQDWRSTRSRCLEFLSQAGVRQSCHIGYESAGIMPLALALYDLKLVRSLVLIDPVTRPQPSPRDAFLAKVEEYLPLGLPFRSSTPGFDCKPFLQRVRCPVLLVGSPQASPYQVVQREVFAKELPSAWEVLLTRRDDAEALSRLTLEFQDVPAKCPQRKAAQGGA